MLDFKFLGIEFDYLLHRTLISCFLIRISIFYGKTPYCYSHPLFPSAGQPNIYISLRISSVKVEIWEMHYQKCVASSYMLWPSFTDMLRISVLHS